MSDPYESDRDMCDRYEERINELASKLAAAKALCVEISKMRDEQMVRGDSFKERAEKMEKAHAAAMEQLRIQVNARHEAEAERDRLWKELQEYKAFHNGPLEGGP